MDTDRPIIYFMNTKTYIGFITYFWTVIVGLARGGPSQDGDYTGQIVYDPERVAPDGSLGVYRFEFQPPFAYHFSVAIRIHTVLAASMPLLEDNLAWYVPEPGLLPYVQSALPSYQSPASPCCSTRTSSAMWTFWP